LDSMGSEENVDPMSRTLFGVPEAE